MCLVVANLHDMYEAKNLLSAQNPGFVQVLEKLKRLDFNVVF